MAKPQDNLVWQQAKQEKTLYEYLRNSVVSKPPQEMLQEFSHLFLELIHSDQKVRQTLENLVYAKSKQEFFFPKLNYCCHILINYWSQNVENYSYINELLEIFNPQNIPEKKFNNRLRQKLFNLVKSFHKTEEYHNLKRIANFINADTKIELQDKSLMSDLLPHYFYLYSSVLLGQEHIPETTNLILNLQQKRQKNFESQLAKHIIYRSRLVQIARAEQLSNRAGKIIQRAANPTFLGEKDLKRTLKQYLNKINGQGTIYQNAKQFLIEISFLNSYKDFKQSLSQYLIFGIQQPENNPFYLQRKLNQIINDGIFDQYNVQPCTNSLILQTCQRLFRFWIIDTTRHNNHYQLIELIMNLGVTQATALLIKIALISPRSKSDLEQRLGILYACYESRNVEEGKWLIQLLENILVAFSLYYGDINLSIAKIR